MAKRVYITEFDANGKPYYRTLSEMESKTHKAASKIDESFKKIGAGIATYFAGREIFEFAKDSVMLASKLQGVKSAFEKLGNSVRTLETLRKATKGTVSELQLMQAAVKADNFKIPLNLLAKGLEFANKRAIQTGESVDYMVDSFITGVARKSIPILDNLGISQVTLNKEIEKTGDFYTAIGNIVSEENIKMAGGIDTATEAFQRLNAQIENSKANIGEKLIPVWGNFLSITSALLDDWTLLFKYIGDPYAIQKAMYLEQMKYAGGNDPNNPGLSNLKALGIGSITPNMYAPGPQTPQNIAGGSGGKGGIPMLAGRRMDNPQRYLEAVMNNAGTRGGELGAGAGFGMMEMQQVTVPELKMDFEEIGQSFINKFSETQNIAYNIGNIFGSAASGFLSTMMQAFDIGSSIFAIIGSVANIASGGIGGLFGLAEGGTVINKHGKLSYAPIPKFARGGTYTVPPGYANDSGLIRVQSGERVDVTPTSQVPQLGRLLSEIKSSIQAGNMNSARKGNKPIVIYNTMDGQVVSTNVIRNQNRMNKAGKNFGDYD